MGYSLQILGFFGLVAVSAALPTGRSAKLSFYHFPSDKGYCSEWVEPVDAAASYPDLVKPGPCPQTMIVSNEEAYRLASCPSEADSRKPSTFVFYSKMASATSVPDDMTKIPVQEFCRGWGT
jgi:hypothetical protein